MIAIQRTERITSSFVVMTSIIGASLCAYLLYADVYLRRTLVNGLELAGTLSERSLTVQRKLGDRLIWDPIESDESLYWNDSIQTLPHASAKIKLKDGGEISLGESSLVVLERNDNKLALNLKSGQLVVDSDIQINGLDLSKGGGKVALQVDDKKGELTATKTSADGLAKQYVVDSKGRVVERDVAVSLVSPEPLAKLYVDAAPSQTTFKWASRPQYKKQEIQIASDKDFKNIISRQGVTGQTINFSLDSGLYYWRLVVSDGKVTENSETRSFVLQQTVAPLLVGPDQGKKIAYRGQNPLVEFQWKGVRAATKYTLEVSESSDFKNVIASQETSESYLKTSKISGGRYLWRVVAHYGPVTKASDARPIEFEKLADMNPPKLTAPADEFLVDYSYFEQNQGIPFSWSTEGGAGVAFNPETYRFVLAKNKKLSDVVVAFETQSHEALVKDLLAQGSYYWTVQYKNADDSWAEKEVREFAVGPMVPLLTAPQLLAPTKEGELDLLKAPGVRWSWSPVEGAKAYKFKLYKVDGSNVKSMGDESLKGLEHSMKDLPDGTYRWTVSAIDNYGRESKPNEQTFNVVHGYQLDAPEFEMNEVQ